MKEKLSRVEYNRLCAAVLALFSLLSLLYASLGELRYDEIDSIALPTISIQYRGTIVINESDIRTAQKDFSSLYEGIDGFEDLRMSKLRKITEEDWLSYYFPVYPASCIPVKLLLEWMGLPQERAFSVTNALLVTLTLAVVYKALRVSDRQKLLALLLLGLSPASYYINYICYETFMFAMVTVSMVLYQRESYKSSAFFLALAGQCNATVMAAGFVMIAAYFIRIFAASRGKSLMQLIRENFWETACYAAAFTPCLTSIIIPKVFKLNTAFNSVGSLSGDYWKRFWMYLFDPNLGLTSFAPLQLLFLLVCLAVMLRKRKWGGIGFLLFLLADILAFSAWDHINCGMIYCARYLVWCYPIAAIFIAVYGIPLLSGTVIRVVVSLVMLVVTVGLFRVNGDPHCQQFNAATVWLLDNIPAVYNPYSATFYSRALHIDGGYWETKPVYYLDSQGENAGEIRKLIYKANETNVTVMLKELTGTEASVEHLQDRLEKNGLDDGFHYISISPGSEYQLREKTESERYEVRLGDTLVQQEDIALNWTGSYYETFYPITVADKRDYQITLELAAGFDIANADIFFVDFFAQDGYDHPAQENMNFLQEGTLEYTFTINAGSLADGTKDAYFRIICFPKEYQGESMNIKLADIREVESMEERELSQSELEWLRSLA